METILILTIVVIALIIYNFINKPSPNEIENAKISREAQAKSLTDETIKKTLFSQFNNYLIEYFKANKLANKEVFIQKLSADFPYYGSGILNQGIFKDLLEYKLVDYYYKNYELDINKLVLGRTFNIIYLNFPNFAKFYEVLVGPDWVNIYQFSRYMWNNPETFIFNQKLKQEKTNSEFTFRFWILTGTESVSFLDKHLEVLEMDKKYLTTHIYFKKLLYFDYIVLDIDLTIDEYKVLYESSLKKAETYIDNFEIIL